jgi:hypothetical protein
MGKLLSFRRNRDEDDRPWAVNGAFRSGTSYLLEPDRTGGSEVVCNGYRFVGAPEEGWSPEQLHVCRVAGVTFYDDALQSDAFAPLQRLSLRLEPDNPEDPNAVAVLDATGTIQVGHLPRDDARHMAPLLRRRTFEAFVLHEWRSREPDVRCGLVLGMSLPGMLQLLVRPGGAPV